MWLVSDSFEKLSPPMTRALVPILFKY